MTEFYGLSTQVIGNDFLRLEYLLEGGLRIVRLNRRDRAGNLLAEVPDFKWVTPYGDYFLHGGHRLWRAPEIFPETYIPDHANLAIEELPDGVRLSHVPPAGPALSKSIEIHVQPDRPAVTLVHQLTNDSDRPIECAPWAITQLILGGIAIMPLSDDAVDPNSLQPDRHLTLWPYTRWSDSRLHVREGAVLVEARSELPPLKIGALNRRGWIAYLIDGVLFRKCFDPAAQPYPDLGSNVEIYCNDKFIELETLGSLQTLRPGQSATHVETWELRVDVKVPATLDGAYSLLETLKNS